jgi:protein-disulfide isomerase
MDRIAASGLEAANIPEKIHLAGSKSRTVQTVNLSFSVAIDTRGAPLLGPENAPVTLVVFSDFECSHCSRVGSLLDEILARYPKQVKIAFKNFPLTFHQHAQPAALAALAAHRQGRFWQFHDLLFENQKNLSEAKFVEIATRLNLNLEKFNSDRKAPSTRQELERDLNEAHKAGVRGTPTIFINGRLLKERSMAQVQQMVDQELAKQNRTRGAPR